MKIFCRFMSLIVTFALIGCGDVGINSDSNTLGEVEVDSDALISSGYQVVTQETSLDDLVTKQLEVLCASGTKAIGAGWGVLDSTSAILNGKATHFTPNFDGSGWLVEAELETHSSIDWKLRVSVTCAPESSLTGYEIITGETPVDHSTIKSLILNCPSGKKAIGSGWGALDETDAMLPGEASYFMPTTYGGSGWYTQATCSATWTPDWKLKSFLICADSDSLPNYEIVYAETAVSNTTPKQVSVLCPSGKKALSAGWGVLDSTGAILPGASLYSLPQYDGSKWTTNAEDRVTWSWTGLWKLRSILICVN